MFFFFNSLYDIPQVYMAFNRVLTQKMLSDGYYDMNLFIKGKIKKETIFDKLKSTKSKYAALFKGAYPKKDNVVDVWEKTIGSIDDDAIDSLTDYESFAIVYWTYRILKTGEENRQFTIKLMQRIKELSSISHNILFERGIVYNDRKVELHFLSSLAEVNDFISALDTIDNNIFYRGHSSPNYSLMPSIMRTRESLKYESNMYQELLIECPNDFLDCRTHFQKLVKMQHYGLPTRLLDVTRNPLVALYFACTHNTDSLGELIVFSAKPDAIKYPHDDVVSLLSSIPALPLKEKNRLADKMASGSINTLTSDMDQLVNEVRLERPTFTMGNDYQLLQNSYVVYAEKSNQRIIKQDGAFILCGFDAERGSLENFRYQENGKKIIVVIDNKKTIMKQLEAFSINHATLFPEIECVSEYISRKYCSC